MNVIFMLSTNEEIIMPDSDKGSNSDVNQPPFYRRLLC